MHVLILGSGVIGTTIAYDLAKAGHEVTVLERQDGPALETSYANAGEVSPGYSAPWAGPGVPAKAVKWLLMRHSPLVIRPMLDPAMWRWGVAMLRNCTQARYEINKSRMVRLAEYSRDCLRQLRAETGIRYDERSLGTLQLFRTQKQLDATGKDIEILEAYGVPYQLLDREGCLQYEPALAAVRHKFVGGLRLPGDETGDCFMFTRGLARLAEAAGVRFRFGVTITDIVRNAEGIVAVHTDAGPFHADRYVVALGSYSPLLLRPLGLRLPVYPVKGFSITVPITDAAMAPESTVMDETFKVAVTRLGARIRVGGTAQLSGYDLRLNDRRRDTLEHVVTDLFPEGGSVEGAEFWTGLRPMTPDGTPLLGATPIPGLLLATGHGTLGWTMAAGTGRVMADLIAGRQPEIDMEGLGLERYA
ncbi:D-amino acid dehydrogenase small subunit [Variovorax sp. PBL-H6]|uniref:D-amino acid dehydrogenase n=1 Tax=Variovorax sp. PBL-H6 TaxID=434009 RepID=UPI00131784E3|nr:D-amino acid dehydrogenase [Variovorax sp. PBL-H6]VTU27262.1 D-amino acid dehydrogenase small subunit [Variovorax sp. PBL-H6]